MTRRDKLLALADRCEAASGSDKDIDCWIENHLGLSRFEPDRPSPIGGGWLDKRIEPKPYTASLDAAMTLVPGDCLAMVRHLWDGDNRAGHAVLNSYVSSREEADGKMWAADFTAVSANPALALCAAALRAKAAMEPSA